MFHCERNTMNFMPILSLDGLIIFSFFSPGAEDIHGGSLKLILETVCRLILRYQIGRVERRDQRSLMLAWIPAGCARLSNFQLFHRSERWNCFAVGINITR